MICGLLGEKLSHSYSPQIHQQLADYRYDLFEKSPDQLASFLTHGEFHGINVTIPYKKSVIPYCHKLSPQAQKLEAVNTIVKLDDGKLVGHNTDYFGFQSMANRTGVNFRSKKVLVLGSGGASNTVCAVMKELGAEVVIVSRNGENNYNNLHLHADCRVIVNATPVGMYPNTGISPIDLSLFPNLECVMDLIYNPAKTKLLLDAEALGIRIENGLWMLVAQAKESAQWFTGDKIPDEKIFEIHRKLKEHMKNIVLIGMPGCGKSTIGKLLAQQIGKEFLDADTCIEEVAKCKIPTIFQSQGEPGFRKIETQVLSDICKKSGYVIATGGGCVTRKENFPLLRQNSTVIWIKRDLEQLPTEGRPISQATKLHELYAVRRPLYETFSDLTIENNGTPEDAVAAIIKEISK